MAASLTTRATWLNDLMSGRNPAAWQEFYERYAEFICRIARGCHVQPAECEDVVHEVFLALQAMEGRFQYDPSKGRFRSYLKKTVRRTIARISRQKAVPRPLQEDEHPDGPRSIDPAFERLWEEEWRQYHVRRGLRTIASEYGRTSVAAFERYVVKGQSPEEVAAALGISTNQVYQVKSRILRRLMQLIEQQVAQEG
jgi:RNA polymerase sigma factor (sigma-70 family)